MAADIEAASALLAADPAEAGRRAEAALRASPRDPRAALVLASSRRRLGDAAGARTVLEPLARAYPKAALTQYELGMALGALGEVAPAEAALRRALTLKPDLAEAWRALGEQLFRQGDSGAAEAAFAKHARAAVTDPALRPAAEAIFAADLDRAERLLRSRVTTAPGDAAALAMLAEVFLRTSREVAAETLLRRALEIDSRLDGARFNLADSLFRQQRGSEALDALAPLLERDPGDFAYRNLEAACLGLIGDQPGAIRLYEALLADSPRTPGLWLNLGHAFRTIGRADDAIAAYNRSIELAPGLGLAYWSLANLKTAPISALQERAMQAQLARADVAGDDRAQLHYALGKALEDRGDFAASFEHYAAGAALRRADTPYDRLETTMRLRAIRHRFTPAFFAARAGAGSPSRAPIFVVGLPRAGSTLIEQILASHSQVEGTMELPDIDFIAARLPAPVDALNPAQRAELGELYLRRAAVQRRLGRPRFIDKMPNNFQHIGLIQLILPNATIIDARRHPMASGFSAFKQHFAGGQGFSYDLADLGRYYADYVELMAHFDRALPARLHRVIYEDLVADTEGEVRRLLDHCGLSFEPACLEFHRTKRAVRTVSSEQVRRPIFREGLERWRDYEPWLDPLKAALGPALETWRA